MIEIDWEIVKMNLDKLSDESLAEIGDLIDEIRRNRFNRAVERIKNDS